MIFIVLYFFKLKQFAALVNKDPMHALGKIVSVDVFKL